MWPFNRKKKDKSKVRKAAENVVAGVIIGAAISSIIGKTMLDKDEKKDE